MNGKLKEAFANQTKSISELQNMIKEKRLSKKGEKESQQEIEENERNQVLDEDLAFSKKIKQFIDISKHFSSPLKKDASYICETELVSYPSTYAFEYKKGGVATEHIKFSNLVLEAIYVKLYKMSPELEQLKFINLSISRSKRIPPGLSFNLGFVYDDANEKPATNARVVFVAVRKTSTPCYQICDIELIMSPQKVKMLKYSR